MAGFYDYFLRTCLLCSWVRNFFFATGCRAKITLWLYMKSWWLHVNSLYALQWSARSELLDPIRLFWTVVSLEWGAIEAFAVRCSLLYNKLYAFLGLLFAIRYSLFAIRYSLFAIRFSQFAFFLSFLIFAIRFSLFAIRFSKFAFFPFPSKFSRFAIRFSPLSQFLLKEWII